MSLQGGSFQADISPEIVAGVPLIRSYGDDYFTVGRQRYNSSIMLHQGETIAPWNVDGMNALTLSDLQSVFNQPPDIFILGTGRRISFPAENIVTAFQQAHIGFEFMDSRAAARTYNIIVGEGRIISACLFLPSL